MELKELFEMQRKLDKRIIKEHNLEGQNLIQNKILALLVEVGELANEWQGFKHWKVNPKPKDGMLEEYVDCLHFILSIGLSLGMDWRLQDGFEASIYSSDITKQFNKLFEDISTLGCNLNCVLTGICYLFVIERFLSLGKLLGFTEDSIIQAYRDKNKINHQRQENGY